MKKILIPTILLTGITPAISMAGCSKQSIAKVNVNQNATFESCTALSSDIFIVNTAKKYRLNVNCSSSTATSWQDEGQVTFLTPTGSLSPVLYDVTYVKLDGQKLTLGDHMKQYWIKDIAGGGIKLCFRWDDHVLSKDSKMTIDVKFKKESNKSEVSVLWENKINS